MQIATLRYIYLCKDQSLIKQNLHTHTHTHINFDVHYLHNVYYANITKDT